MWDHSRLEVRSTSTPITNSSGIWDIMLDDYAELLYLYGMTEEITTNDNVIASLKGGRIDAITSRQHVFNNPHIEMFVRDYEYDVVSKILSGTWNVDHDGINGWDTFSIDLIDDPDYSPAIENIKFTIIPEPATLGLLSLGGLMIHRRKR